MNPSPAPPTPATTRSIASVVDSAERRATYSAIARLKSRAREILSCFASRSARARRFVGMTTEVFMT